jgi:hypothetical protein
VEVELLPGAMANRSHLQLEILMGNQPGKLLPEKWIDRLQVRLSWYCHTLPVKARFQQKYKYEPQRIVIS